VQESIYIIGGKYRKKKITFPNTPNLRPTTNRIRETVFNWLMHDIRGAACLDAYAGSGALGLEAISRGASYVTFIENDIIAHQGLKKTIATFTNEPIMLVRENIEEYLKKTPEEFDIIFIDPPFSQPFPKQCIDYLAHNKVLKTGGLIYIEYNSSLEINPGSWENIKNKRAGQVTYALYKKLNYSKIPT